MPRCRPPPGPAEVALPAPGAEELAQAAAAAARWPEQAARGLCLVSVRAQALYLLERGAAVAAWPVSTARRGVGARRDSLQTPPGAHRVVARIGAGAPEQAVFEAREPTGERAAVAAAPRPGDRERITTRILWLDGLEPGLNRGGEVDSRARCIYIHGTNEEELIGRPASRGCVRMRARDVIELFDRVRDDALVLILP